MTENEQVAGPGDNLVYGTNADQFPTVQAARGVFPLGPGVEPTDPEVRFSMLAALEELLRPAQLQAPVRHHRQLRQRRG